MPNPGERCYAVMNSSIENTGAETFIKVRDGFTLDPNGMHINDTIWVRMAANWWVEAGYFYGRITFCGPTSSPRWYTAHNNAAGYWDTCIGSVPAPSIGSDHLVRFERLSIPNTSWLLSIDGTLVYNHTSMKSSSFLLTGGVETSHWSTRLNTAWMWSYKYRSVAGTWSSGLWPSVTVQLVGMPSAYGSVIAPFAVFEHGFWGV
jgi:hypothetical protein